MSACSFKESFSGILSEKDFANKTEKVFTSNATTSRQDIQYLFTSFNNRFFWSHLHNVEVFWSNRMTSCAGLCYYNRKRKHCYIRLSSPLLKLRPHSDLVNTLLHEMIHAYLFLTNKDSSRDGHGPNFHKHKDRINKEAGTNITVYHSFHSEVKLYKQHWWRCNGPCQFEWPYFGMIKRSINRQPGSSDSWWNRHKSRCSGTFIKIREPIQYSSKKNIDCRVKGQGSEERYGLENIIDYVDLTHLVVPGASSASWVKTKRGFSSSSVTIDLTEEPKAKKSKTNSGVCACPVCNCIVPCLSVAEHLESCNGMQNIFDFDLVEDIEDSDNENSEDTEPKNPGQSCPLCSSCVEGDLKSHVDDCLNNSGIVNIFDEATDPKESKYCNENVMSASKGLEYCPVCGVDVLNNFEDHFDNCTNNSDNKHDLEVNENELPEKSCDLETKVYKAVLDDSCNSELANVRNDAVCPVCNKRIEINIEAHINDCLNNSMSSSDFDEPIQVEPESPTQVDLTLVPSNSKRNYNVADNSRSNKNTNVFVVRSKNILKCSDHQSKDLKMSFSSDKSIDLGDSASSNQSEVSKTVGLKKNPTFVDLTDGKKSCPVCAKYISGDMNSHLDQCLNTSCSVVDFEDPIIVVSDTESPVKVVNSNYSKIPMPKMLYTDNNDSERRVACCVCGMKFGVSKFNGHVCYGSGSNKRSN